MDKLNTLSSIEPTTEDYERLIEKLRVRMNVLNASVFLLGEKLSSNDSRTSAYLSKINNELEAIRTLMLANPLKYHQN